MHGFLYFSLSSTFSVGPQRELFSFWKDEGKKEGEVLKKNRRGHLQWVPPPPH